MISFESRGSFGKTESFLQNLLKPSNISDILARYGAEGVSALAAATPIDSSLTANSWDYHIVKGRSSYSIVWTNSNIVDGRPIAILLQFGHGTGTGGYIPGRDYINPAIQPIFDKIAENVWKAVTSA